MNQLDHGSLKLMPLSISHPNIEQRLPKMMQQARGSEQLATAILQIALNNSDSSTILSDLATTICQSFTANGCVVISQGTNSLETNQIGYWQETGLFTESAIEQLSRLSIHQDSTPSSLVETTSPLYKTIDCLIENILPTRTWLGITTQFQGRTNGLVLLFKSGSAWSHDEHQLLTQSLNPLAIAIAQAQLQQQSCTKSRYQTLLNNLSQQISQGYRLESFLQNCLSEIGHALKLDRSLILMFKYRNPLRAKDRDYPSGTLRDRDLVKGTANINYQWSSEQASLPAESSFNLNHSNLCQQAWRNAPNCLYLNHASFPDVTVDSVPTIGSALLMMPLMGKKTSETDSAMVLGFLVLQSNTMRNWSQDELELISWVGVQMSTAIIHEQTLNRVQLVVDERTAQLKSSMDMQGKLSTKMRQHIKQLQKLNQLKDDFMNSMSHELKTPLTSMKIAIKMLRQTEISPQMREKYLDILEEEWNREYNLIKDLLTLQQVESGELSYKPQELHLGKTIEDLRQSFVAKWQTDRNLNLVCAVEPPKLKIHTDAESLEYILHELLLNAGKYCDAQTTIELSASHQLTATQSEIVIAVTNVGAGITPEELPYIFDKFRRGKGVTDRAVPGTGLGLTLVQYLVEHLNGKIEVTSNPVDDEKTIFVTTFVLKLPQIQPSIG
ncbi:GAF domain-containing sensor histidine kinase [Pleurocapsa sp. CCALA 161]|uniref:GAF domain-containing sensor histidine kinase n=1 Tax=Pleurocapsa sp. CCALA 161 TaxID=2107688 RepID=UPI001E43A2B1|nr:GAF domain-containing sensor histidine kinase [Pleurocapsa sp. CCALA 161]